MSLPPIKGERPAVSRRVPSNQTQRHAGGTRHASPPPASFDDDSGVADSSTTGTCTSSIHTTAADRRDVSDFRIVVAARIRPFTEREVRCWRQERRAAESPEEAEEARRARAAQRQPFGPGHKSLNVTQARLDGTWSKHNDKDNDFGAGNSHRASLDTSEVPQPVVEVESDGKTVVLLDVQSLANGGHAMAPVRNAFTYDYVYSSFDPNVQLDAQLSEESPTGRGGRRSSYVILDGDEEGGGTGTNGAIATHATSSSHTPAQEREAEAEQVAIYEQLAIPLVDAAMHGYNTCMFAYGQTGSGKTYTMMGTPRHPGLIPRLCQLLFAEVAARNDGDRTATGQSSSPAPVTLQLSYMEIYNEQVRDLLKQRPKNAILRYNSRFDKKDVDSDEYRTLKVRHHPTNGIYVDGLTSVPVRTWVECEAYLQQGNALRTQCSTAMNAKSSRSHAIFQLQMTQREGTGGRVRGREVALETVSKMNLVDLAGSERNTQSKTTGKHLAEANSINASLSTLRRVLDGLIANRAAALNNGGHGGAGKGKKAGVVIPYRESLLTYVLSDNLGGNSFTVMCANVSPCAANAGETESTLRYATLAKSVVNHAKLNEAPTARVIREMRDRLRVMQEALRSAPDPTHVAELEEGVHLSEELLREMKVREGDYEAQLQAQAAQAEALRQAVEAHKRQETFWRDEAQRQQREVEELREALFEATQNGTSGKSSLAGASKTNGVGRGGISGPLHLPSLNAMHTPSTPHLPVDAIDGRDDTSAKKAQKPKKRSSSSVSPTNNAAAAARGGELELLLSPASRDWKPTRTRGTPLSLMGGARGKQRPSRTPLPAPPEAPASAPLTGRRVSRASSSNTGGAAVATAPSSRPQRSAAKKKPSTTSLAPRPPLSKNVHDADKAGEEVPSFYQTEEFLLHNAEVLSSSKLDAALAEVDGLVYGSSEAPQPPASPPRALHENRPLDLHELLDMQQLQEQAEVLNSEAGGRDVGLEIEGVAATPSKRWPTQSPRVAEARKAQAALDRRRSSTTVADNAAANPTKKLLKKKKKTIKNSVSDDPSREASAEQDSVWTPEANSVSMDNATAAGNSNVLEARGSDAADVPSVSPGERDVGFEDDAEGSLARLNDDEAEGLHLREEEVVEPYADDTASAAAASLTRSTKAAGLEDKPRKKKKTKKGSGSHTAGTGSWPTARHYSTVDTLH